MRLFIFNGSEPKYVLESAANGSSNLFDMYLPGILAILKAENPDIAAKLPKSIAQMTELQKEQLFAGGTAITEEWASAKNALKAVVIKGSKNSFVNGRLIYPPTPPPVNASSTITPQSAFDFYLDQATGWCAMSKNYSIFREADETGNIADKGTLITNNTLKPAWEDFSNKYWIVKTEGATSFANQLLAGTTNIIPFSADNFYGGLAKMGSEEFFDLVRIVKQVTSTIWAIKFVEWPVVGYDLAYQQWHANGFSISNADKVATFKSVQSTSQTISTTLSYKDPKAMGALPYLEKLKSVSQYLTILYKQMSILQSCQNFDFTSVDKSKKEIVMGVIADILQTLSSITFNTLTAGLGPLAAVASAALPTNLLGNMNEYFQYKNQALRQLGPNVAGVQEAFQHMKEILMVAYYTYLIFLSQYGLEQIVLDKDSGYVQKKLQDAEKYFEAKNRQLRRLTPEDVLAEIDSLNSNNPDSSGGSAHSSMGQKVSQ